MIETNILEMHQQGVPTLNFFFKFHFRIDLKWYHNVFRTVFDDSMALIKFLQIPQKIKSGQIMKKNSAIFSLLLLEYCAFNLNNRNKFLF